VWPEAAVKLAAMSAVLGGVQINTAERNESDYFLPLDFVIRDMGVH
jgi:hypothetical protein